MKSKLLLSAITSIAITSCGDSGDSKSTESKPQDPPPAKQPTAEELAAAAEQAAAEQKAKEEATLNEKLNAYISLINSMSASHNRSMQRYLSWVDEKTGKATRKQIYGLYKISITDSLEKKITKHVAMEPKIAPLDDHAAEFLSSLKALIAIVNPLQQYFDQEDYKDDKFKRSLDQHADLMAAFKKTAEADNALRSAIDAIQNKMKLEELAELEKDESLKAVYFLKKFMLDAEAVVKAGNSPVKEINKADLKTAVETMNATIEAFQAFASNSENAELRGLKEIQDFFKHSNNVPKFQKASKLLNRRVQNDTPYTRGELMNVGKSSEWMVKGSPGALLNTYNAMIGNYNRLRF